MYILIDSRNYNQEGYGEFGFQVALTQNPERIIITSPGSFYFRGKKNKIRNFKSEKAIP